MRNVSAPKAPTVGMKPGAAFTIFAVVTLVACVLLGLFGYLDAVVMGIVQGLGEFLPISSSAHLILMPWFFGWKGGVVDSLTFNVALHLGTLIAVVAYFWRDWVTLIRAVPDLAHKSLQAVRGNATPLEASERLLLFVVVATIPGAVLGLLLKGLVDSTFRSPLLIAATLPILGVLLYAADRFQPQQRALDQITWRDALLIGISQGCALVPGISRSGATMTMGRFLQLDRSAAARFSFLLSAPITAAAVLSEASNILAIGRDEIATFLIGTLISGAVGALAIHFLLDYIRRAGFGIFALYRVVLAVVIVVVWLARGA